VKRRDHISKILTAKGISVERDVSLAEATSYGIGGPADILVLPSNPEQTAAALGILADEDIPVFPIGRGTNILAADAGFRGALLRVEDRGFDSLGAGEFEVGAATSIDELVDATATAGYAGAQGLAGIPGSLGGGIAMNAGAWGFSTGRIVKRVVAFDLKGNEIDIRPDGMFEYRGSEIRGNAVVASATIALDERGDPKAIASEAREYRLRRARTQPLGYKSAGCVFKNPQGDHAGRMIDDVGLKGKAVGGAAISDVHANFIVNIGGATADDVLRLIEIVRDRVRSEFGVELELEIIRLGFDR